MNENETFVVQDESLLVEWISDADIKFTAAEIAEDHGYFVGRILAIGTYAFSNFSKYFKPPKVGEYILFNSNKCERCDNFKAYKSFIVQDSDIEAFLPDHIKYYNARHF